MGPAALAQVLRPLDLRHPPGSLVGLQTSDDAAVFRMSADLALVQTVDFFTPIVDDPWTYGAIAAANSMSDVYAMGGDVLFALNVAGFPEDLPGSILAAIFRGGADKVAEAGGVIAGGHTVTDAEPKFGLVVTGTIHPDRVLTKAGARPGDVLFLTKPIGTGVITTALKNQAASAEAAQAAIDSMLRLNRRHRERRGPPAVHACTDITGFGLLGQAWRWRQRAASGCRSMAAVSRSCRGHGSAPRQGSCPAGCGATVNTSRRSTGERATVAPRSRSPGRFPHVRSRDLRPPLAVRGGNEVAAS